MNKLTNPAFMATWGMMLGSGIGALLALLFGASFGHEDPLILSGLGAFIGAIPGAFAGEWAWKAIRDFQDETVERAALEFHKKRSQSEVTSLPEWWPTDEELDAALNESTSGNEPPEVEIIVSSPRTRKRPNNQVSKSGSQD